jgi:hypothetical protein
MQDSQLVEVFTGQYYRRHGIFSQIFQLWQIVLDDGNVDLAYGALIVRKYIVDVKKELLNRSPTIMWGTASRNFFTVGWLETSVLRRAPSPRHTTC